MKKEYKSGLLVSVLALCVTPAHDSRVEGQVSDRVQAVLTAYLSEDCGSGEESPTSRLDAVVSLGEAAIAPLLLIVERGPSAEDLEMLESDAVRDFEARREFLDKGDGLSRIEEQEVRTLALEQSQEDYLRMRKQGFENSYRERALNALVAFGSRDVADRLRGIADSIEETEMRGWLEEAIEKLDGG